MTTAISRSSESVLVSPLPPKEILVKEIVCEIKYVWEIVRLPIWQIASPDPLKKKGSCCDQAAYYSQQFVKGLVRAISGIVGAILSMLIVIVLGLINLGIAIGAIMIGVILLPLSLIGHVIDSCCCCRNKSLLPKNIAKDAFFKLQTINALDIIEKAALVGGISAKIQDS